MRAGIEKTHSRTNSRTDST